MNTPGREPTAARLVGIFGGTFDPVHSGHIRSVVSLLDEIPFERVHLLPSNTPPHRSPASCACEHRFRMVELAVAGHARLVADNRECKRGGRSYTIDTLENFREQYPQQSLGLIAGMDAYLDMPNWKDSRNYLEYAHIIVMRRPGYHCTESWGDAWITRKPGELRRRRCGNIYFANTLRVNLSSTQIRRQLDGSEPAAEYLPARVVNYINQNQLYAAS